jgi:heme-degrading monooxygenase HmoA
MSIYALTRMTYSDDIEENVVKLATDAGSIFEKQPGFRGMQRYKATGKNDVIAILEWDDEDCHHACMESPDWKPWLPLWQELMGSGKLEFEVELFERMDT